MSKIRRVGHAPDRNRSSEKKSAVKPNRGPWFADVPPTGSATCVRSTPNHGAGEGSLRPWGFDRQGGARKRGVQGGETVAGEGGALVVFDSGLGRGGRYNGSVLQQQQNQEAYRSAARRRGAEKPRLGVSGRNPASHRGFARCKSQTALGLPAVEPKTRVRSFCSGEQYDTDLSLYYLRARYYNPTTGRFLNVDPLAGQGQRRYEYAGANPVDGSDPSGNFVLASYWPQMAALQIHIPLPSWCGAGSTGPIGSHLPPCRPRLRHVVKEMEDGKPIKGYWASKGNFVERDVTYWAYDLEPDGSRGYRDTNDTISLIEKTAAGSNVGTCSSVQACPGTPREFVDDQRVFQHAPFTVQRYWYVGGIQALVWNAKTDNSTAPFETLRLDYDANPTFAITYGK